MNDAPPPFQHPADNETLEAARARNVRDALAEDIGRCDWTALLVPAGRRVRASVTAKEQAVPAYVILHDKTLRELAEVRPVSYGLLASITGMGSAKIEHYGEELLALIREAA